MVNRSVPVIVLVSLLFAALFIWSPLGAATRPQSQSSCDVSWTSATGGLWTDPDNWSTGSVPGASSRVCITLDGTYTVTLTTSTTVRSLTLGADDGTQTLLVRGGGGGNVTLTVTNDLANSGEIRLESDASGSASNLTVSEGTLTNAEDGVINVNAGAGGSRTITARLDNHGEINVNTDLTLGRPGADHTNSGSIDITGGNLSLVQTGDTPSFTNTGHIQVAQGRTLTIQGGSFSHTSPGAISGGGTVNIQGAAFSGNGPIVANVTNAGQVSPGSSAGALNIAGNYSQTSAGVLALEIGGTAAGSGFDQLNVSGSVALAGALNLTTIGNFIPSPCDSFQVMTYSSRTGGFSSINGLAAGGSMFFRPDLGNGGLSLVAYNTASEVNISTNTVNVAEGGASASYRVCLASQPTADVTVAVTPDAQVTVDPASLSFTLAQWSAIRSVAVSAVDDSVAEGPHSGTIHHSASSTDPRYNGIGVPSVTARIADNEGLGEPPEAQDVSVTTPEDTPIEITLVATDPDGDSLTFSIVEQPDHGDLGAISGNRVRYTPDANFHGTDTFRFRASDGSLNSNTAIITITVEAENDDPDARDDSVSTGQGKTVDIAVLSNDTDVDGDTLSIASVSAPAHGTASVVGNRVRYTPDTSFTGTDSFTYKVSDGHGGEDTARVTVRVVTPPEEPPGNFVGKIEFTGIVQALPDSGLLGKWKIQGLTVEVTAGTEVKLETPAVIGAVAKVEGYLLTNGVIQAKEIKVGDDHLPWPCNWKECGDDDDFRWPPPCNWKPDLPACNKAKKWLDKQNH